LNQLKQMMCHPRNWAGFLGLGCGSRLPASIAATPAAQSGCTSTLFEARRGEQYPLWQHVFGCLSARRSKTPNLLLAHPECEK
jgi:hypothetical protein